MPGMFDEENLDDLYDPAFAGAVEGGIPAESRKAINNYLSKYNSLMSINIASAGRRTPSGVTKLHIANDLVTFQGTSTHRVHQYLLNLTGSEEPLSNVKTDIKDNIGAMLEFLKQQKGGLLDTRAGLMQLFTGDSLDNAQNIIKNMFDDDDNLFTSLHILHSLKAIQNKLFMTKIFI